MSPPDPVVLVLVGAVAFLYSGVGHAGASGYIAVLTLAGWSPVTVRPLALVLNVFVAAVAAIKFYRAGYFRPALFLPIIALSLPAAAFGGYLKLSAAVLSRVIGFLLCLSAMWLLAGKREPVEVKSLRPVVGLFTGAAIGFLAGLSGTGGGILLSPLMIFCRWGKLKEVSAVAAPFILLNSVGGLIGLTFANITLPPQWFVYVLVAVLGGFAGSTIGTRIVRAGVIQALLAIVLVVAGSKLLFLTQ